MGIANEVNEKSLGLLWLMKPNTYMPMCQILA
jgi:hypothetical protein